MVVLRSFASQLVARDHTAPLGEGVQTAALEDVSNAATWWMSLQQVVTDEASPTLLSQLVAPARTAAVDAPKLLYAGDCALVRSLPSQQTQQQLPALAIHNISAPAAHRNNPRRTRSIQLALCRDFITSSCELSPRASDAKTHLVGQVFVAVLSSLHQIPWSVEVSGDGVLPAG